MSNNTDFSDVARARAQSYAQAIPRHLSDLLVRLLRLDPTRRTEGGLHISYLDIFRARPLPETFANLATIRASSVTLETPGAHKEYSLLWETEAKGVIANALRLHSLHHDGPATGALLTYVRCPNPTTMEALLQWAPLGERRPELDALIAPPCPFPGSYEGMLRALNPVGSQCPTTAVLALSLGTRNAQLHGGPALEAGLKFRPPNDREEPFAVHLAVGAEWAFGLPKVSPTPTASASTGTTFVLDTAILEQNLRFLVQRARDTARKNDWPLVIAVYDSENHAPTWLDDIGASTETLEIIDLYPVWACLLNRRDTPTTPLYTALRWASPHYTRQYTDNAGDDAASVMTLLDLLCDFETVKRGRWYMFCAHTAAQIPSRDVIDATGPPMLTVP